MSARAIIITLIIITTIGVLVFFKIRNSASPAKAAPRGGSDFILAEVMVMRDTTLTGTLQSLGTIRAAEAVEIVSELGGKITGIYFKEGGTVNKGTLLFKLDDAELKAQKQKLEVQEKLASDNESRYHVLQQKGGISRQQYEEVLNALQTSRADLELVKVQLDKTEIRAPFSGKTGLRNVSEGAYVNDNTLLTTLQDVSTVKIDFTVPEKYAGIIRPGQTITFMVENDTQHFSAKVIATEAGIAEETRSLKVRAQTSNRNEKLFTGASARVELSQEKAEKTFLVPTQAIIPSPSGYKVFLVKEGKASPREVTIRDRTEEYAGVTSGLVAGDSLIITNILMLRPEIKVKAVPVNR